MKIAIIDYGLNNIFSIEGAIKSLGYKPEIITSNQSSFNADKIILPGVGAFKAGVRSLKERGLVEFLINRASEGHHILGICLGFQMLLTKSYEFGECLGLNLIEGEVKNIKLMKEYSNEKIPNNGWRNLRVINENDLIFKDVTEKDYFYFIHSYFVAPLDEKIITSKCKYNKLEITSSIQKNNIFGMQFHPEKSGRNGIELLNKFLNY